MSERITPCRKSYIDSSPYAAFRSAGRTPSIEQCRDTRKRKRRGTGIKKTNDRLCLLRAYRKRLYSAAARPLVALRVRQPMAKSVDMMSPKVR